jgi:hypothetical protein
MNNVGFIFETPLISFGVKKKYKFEFQNSDFVVKIYIII